MNHRVVMLYLYKALSCQFLGSDTSTADQSHTQPWEIEQTLELEKCAEFVRKTCGCKMSRGKPCSSLFTREYYIDLRSQASLLTREQLNLVLMGSVMSTVSDGDVVHGRHKPAKRQRLAMNCMH